MILHGDFKCPYCGTYNTVRIDTGASTRNTLLRCDIEVGGCDGMLVMESTVSLNLRIKKVSGEQLRINKQLKAYESNDSIPSLKDRLSF